MFCRPQNERYTEGLFSFLLLGPCGEVDNASPSKEKNAGSSPARDTLFSF